MILAALSPVVSASLPSPPTHYFLSFNKTRALSRAGFLLSVLFDYPPSLYCVVVAISRHPTL